MKKKSSEIWTSFAPHRAALRALLLKKPDAAEHFLKSFELDTSELLSAEVQVKEETITALWTLMAHCTSANPLLPVDAARLFQVSDLGDRGWLLTSARDLSIVLNLIEKFFTHDSLSIDPSENYVTCLWMPPEKFGPLLPVYLASVSLQLLSGQLRHQATNCQVTLPESARPKNEKDSKELMKRFKNDFNAELFFEGRSLTVKLEKSVLSIPFRTSDPSLFQFFTQRINNRHKKSMNPEPLVAETILRDKVKKILLSHLSNADYGCKDIASELGVSTRTLERSLAQRKISLRKLKQELQCEVAQEMLTMGVRVKEVAMKTGFQDVAAFSRAFRLWTGRTPTQYKERITDEQ